MKSEPLRILRMIARLNIGGPAIHTILLTEKLNNRQFESWLVCGKESENEGNMRYLISNEDFPLIRMNELGRDISLFHDIVALTKTIFLILKKKPHIVHTHTAKAGFIGRTAAFIVNSIFRKKIKIFHTFHGHVFSGYFSPMKTKLFLMIERFLGKKTHGIITITPKQQKEILNYGIGRKENHFMIPLGLNLERFYRNPRKTGNLRRELGFAEDDIVIGSVTRLVPIKNMALFIEIAELFMKEREDVKFVIAGDGEEREMLETMILQKNLTRKVMILGFVKDLEDVYSDLDLFLLTSLNEGSPVALIEAVTNGVPSISSDVGGVSDVLSNIKISVLCESGNKQDFYRKIKNYIENREFYEKTFSEERENMFNRYGINRLVKDLSALYQDIPR